jgi:hypothetical protein
MSSYSFYDSLPFLGNISVLDKRLTKLEAKTKVQKKISSDLVKTLNDFNKMCIERIENLEKVTQQQYKKIQILDFTIKNNPRVYFPTLYESLEQLTTKQLKSITTEMDSTNCKNKDDLIGAVLTTIKRKMINNEKDSFDHFFDSKYKLPICVVDFYNDESYKEGKKEWNLFFNIF